MQITSRDYPNPILDAIVDRKSQKPRERSATHAPPHIPKKINLVVRQIGAKIWQNCGIYGKSTKFAI